jgi:4-hydroxy-tetrahydrodipicolinate reductase
LQIPYIGRYTGQDVLWSTVLALEKARAPLEKLIHACFQSDRKCSGSGKLLPPARNLSFCQSAPEKGCQRSFAMSKKTKVAIGGINGRMGRACAKLVRESDDFELVGALGRPGTAYTGKDIGLLHGYEPIGIAVAKDFETLLASEPEILLDNSVHENSVAVARKALEAGIRVVIGTSGIPESDIALLADLACKKKLGALVIPNYSIGAVLMMEFARQAGAFFENVEIVEMHHTRKLDAPSGTAMHTVKKLASARSKFNEKEVAERELLAGSRGGLGQSGVRVHSLRLPGLVSHQEVIFGAPGELLTVRHNSFNMDCFLKGILMSLKYVTTIDHLVVGLDSVLGLAEPVKECARA